MQYRNFYIEWLSRAFREAFAAVGFERRGKVMRTVILWAVAILMLYRIDWSDFPIIGTLNAEPDHEVRFGLCAAIAAVVVFSGFLILHLILQPVRIHKEAWEKIKEDGKLIAGIGDSEADRIFLSEMHTEGFKLYRAHVDSSQQSIKQWKDNMNVWVENVKSHLKERWSISALHDFTDLGSMGGFNYRRADNIFDGVNDEHGFSILCTYSAYLKSLDNIIRHGEYKHLGDVHELLLKRETFNRIGVEIT